MKIRNKQLKKKISELFFTESLNNSILRFIELITPLILVPILLWVKPIEDYAIIASYFVIYFFGIFILNFGTDVSTISVLKYPLSIREIVIAVIFIRIILSIFIFLIIFLITSYINYNFSKYILLLILFEGIINPRFLLINIASLKELIIPSLLFRFIHFIIFLIYLNEMNPYLYIALYSGSSCFIYTSTWLIRVLKNNEVSKPITFNLFKNCIIVFTESWKYFIINITNYIIFRSHLFYSMVVLTPKSFASIELIDRIINMVKVPFNAYSEAFIPYYSKKNNPAKAKQSFLTLLIILFVLLFFIFLGIIILQYYIKLEVTTLLFGFFIISLMFCIELFSNINLIPIYVNFNLTNFLIYSAIESIIIGIFLLILCIIFSLKIYALIVFPIILFYLSYRRNKFISKF
jgi:PST family polysaccharide transporter